MKPFEWEIKKAWWQIIVFLIKRERESGKQKPTPRMSLWVVIKVCQMCHRKLPFSRKERCFPPEWIASKLVIIIGIFRLWTKIYAWKEENVHRRKTLPFAGLEGSWAEIRFSVVCARWRMKISDELWINPLIAFAPSLYRLHSEWLVTSIFPRHPFAVFQLLIVVLREFKAFHVRDSIWCICHR